MGGTNSTQGTRRERGVEYNADGEVVDCIFCRIVRGEKVGGTSVLYETENVVVFRPRGAAAMCHFLAVPKRHIKNVTSLRGEHLDLLSELRAAGAGVVAYYRQSGVNPIEDVPKRLARLKAHHAELGEGGMAKAREEGVFSPQPPGLEPCSAEPTAETEGVLTFGFHVPPANSIDHLHVHCMADEFRSPWARLSYSPGTWWTAHLHDVVARIQRGSGEEND